MFSTFRTPVVYLLKYLLLPNLAIVSLVLFVAAICHGAKDFNVMATDASGDGSHDDSQA